MNRRRSGHPHQFAEAQEKLSLQPRVGVQKGMAEQAAGVERSGDRLPDAPVVPGHQQDRFLALCLSREEPRQFYLDRCQNVRLGLAADFRMPLELAC